MNKDDFYRRVYRVVRRIPTGKLTTYGAIAEQIGARSSSRMVGCALHGVAGAALPGPNPNPSQIPIEGAASLTGSGTLDLNNTSQSIGSVSGESGTRIMLGSGALTVKQERRQLRRGLERQW